MNVNHHPLAVDVADLQVRCLGAARSGGIESHQHRTMKRTVCGIDEAADLFRAKDLRQPDYLPRIWRLGNAPVLLQYLDVEEPQRAQALNDRVRAELQLGKQHRQVLADMLRAKPVGASTKVLAEMLYTMHVGADG